MDTWLVANGDLVLAGGTFATLSGPAKIQQDLGIASLTPYGSDRFHPKWGSVLGQYIGSPVGPMTQALLQSEINRLISNYQKVQLNRMNTVITQGYATVYGLNDLVGSVQSITVTQNYDSFSINATVVTMAGTTVSINSSVAASGPSAG
jgi:phage baseplate assembly protein W